MDNKAYSVMDSWGDTHLAYGKDSFLVWGIEADATHMTHDEIATQAELNGWPEIPEIIWEQL